VTSTPLQWDAGIPAAFASYTFDLRSDRTHDGRSLIAAACYAAGMNSGLWHWRRHGVFLADPPMRLEHRAIRWFVERPLPDARSVLSVGEIATANSLLSNVSLFGVTLADDERMLPTSRRGYAPPIRGIATTRSTVTVRQSGILLHETIVPAGAFVIDDLPPTVNRGDLDVEIVDLAGRTQRLVIPSATTPRMLRRGATRMAFGIGCPLASECGELLVDASARYGLTDKLTLDAGLQWTRTFTSLGMGIAANTAIGALSLDASTAVGSSIPRATATDTPSSSRDVGLRSAPPTRRSVSRRR
jgi:outer membrane usher protein